MEQQMILYVAIAVFSLMVVGLAMTIWEFSQGEPHQQAETAQREQESRHSGHGTQRT